ncbi:MAG: hypothetical protein J6B43_01155 [Lachnospiraceae bacterium]|nr:hypothetical protein [Lachnospiraceae bacterium]
MHKVLFLDIDGVLNTNDGNEKHQTKLRRGKPIDRKKVKRLGKLIRYTGAKLVLHSGWRFWFDENKLPLRKEAAYLLRLLEKQKLSIYDMTPDLTTEEIRAAKRFSLVKAEEILAWLDAHQEVEVWAVLDDLDLQNERVASRQIRTDPSAGLTREKMWAAEKLLNPPIETFEELYRMLREHDRENRIARPREDTITVRLTGEYQFNIYDNTREVYLELATQDGQCYHFHPDYRGAYDYILDALEQPESVAEENEEEIKKAKESGECFMVCFALFWVGMFLLLLASTRFPNMSGVWILVTLILVIPLGIILTKLLQKCRKSAETDGKE